MVTTEGKEFTASDEFGAKEEAAFRQYLKHARSAGYAMRDPRTEPTRMTTYGVPLLEREKVAAVILVSGLWYVLVPGSRPKLVTLEVPVHVINLPPGYVLEAVQPPEVEVILSGPARTFYFFDSANVAANVDATLSQFGRRNFELTNQSVDRPADVTVELIRPSKIKLSLRKADEGPDLTTPIP